MRLPEHLAELLVRLVDLHEAKGRVQFYANQSNAGWHVSYPQGPWFPVAITDLQDLRDGRLIRLRGSPSSGYRGAPTLLGIDAVAQRKSSPTPISRDAGLSIVPKGTIPTDPEPTNRQATTEVPSQNHSAPATTEPPIPSTPPSSLQSRIDQAKVEAAAAVGRARGQLEFMQRAIEALKESSPAERPEREAERDWRSANAKTHVKLAANLLFDAFAEQCWKVTRPDAKSFAEKLPSICAEVSKTIACPEFESVLVETLDAAASKWVKKTSREGAVKDSRQWSDLRAKFADLLRQETELLGKVTDDRLLHAHGTYGAGGGEFGEWSLVGATERVQSDYTLLATHAAVALGAPAGADLVGYFLHNLFSNLSEGSSKYLSYASAETGGMIRSLLEATVMCCTRFERIALENGHRERAAPGAQATHEQEAGKPVSTEPANLRKRVAERAERRKAFLDPILRSKRMTVNQWSDAASAEGVSNSTAFRYYNGEVDPRIDTLDKLARPLGLKAEDLPL